MGTENRKGPLKDVKVLDFTIALAGVYVAWQFADMGAEVWKVERYGSGDQARTWDPFVNGLSTLYTAYNKNKQSIELDLSSQEVVLIYIFYYHNLQHLIALQHEQ